MGTNEGRQGQGSYIPQELLREIGRINTRLLVGMPCEIEEEERRLPLTPEAVDMLTDCGHRVLVESGAGLGINYSDSHFSEAGAEIVDTPEEVIEPISSSRYSPPYAGGSGVYEASHYPLLVYPVQPVQQGSLRADDGETDHGDLL